MVAPCSAVPSLGGEAALAWNHGGAPCTWFPRCVSVAAIDLLRPQLWACTILAAPLPVPASPLGSPAPSSGSPSPAGSWQPLRSHAGARAACFLCKLVTS